MENKWKIIYYILPNGENPVKDFLDDHPRAKLKALRILSNIKEFGLSYAILILKNYQAHLFGKSGFWEKTALEFFM